MRKLILLAAVVALLPSLLWAQTIEEKDTVKIREFSDLTNLGTIGTGDTSLQVAAYDPVTDSINERTSFNAILRGVQYVLSAGYGIDFANLTFSVDTINEIASKDYVDNLIDDVVGGSGNASGRSLQAIPADGTDTLTFGGNSYSTDYWQIDLSAVTSTTVTFSNPNGRVVPTYNVHFLNAATDTVTFASVFLDANRDTIESYVFEQGQIVPMYFDSIGGHYYTNYLTIPTNSSSGGATISEGTPVSVNDPAADEGAMLYDNDYLYVKTGAGWLRSELAPLVSYPTLNYQDDAVLYCLKGEGITADGNGASEWQNIIDSTNNITQSVNANKPDVTGDSTLIFDGTDDYMELPDILSTGQDSVTILVAVKRDADTTGQSNNITILSYQQSANEANRVNLSIVSMIGTESLNQAFRTFIREDNSTYVTIDSDTTYALSDSHIVAVRVDEGGTIDLDVNSDDVGSDGVASLYGTATENRRLGASASGSYFQGEILAVVMYNRRLSDAELSAEINTLNSYLSQ